MIFLTACSSLSTSTFSEKKYVGKLSLSQNNKVSNFTVRIVVFYEDLIIQVSKPFLGNLLKIKFNPYEGFSSYSETINLDLSLFKNANNKEYANFFYSCFDILSPSQNLFILDKNDFQLRCEFEEVNVFSFSFKAFNDLTINGALKRE